MSSVIQRARVAVPGGIVASVCPALSVVIPLLVTTLRASAAPSWRTDPAIVRGLGMIPAGLEQLPSSTLVALAALVPMGGRGLRAALVSAVATALASWIVYRLALRLQQTRGPTRLAALLALCASLIATLSSSWQVEGSTPGGAALASAAALGALAVLDDHESARGWLGAGFCVGVAACESLPVGAFAALGCLLLSVARLKLPSPRELAFLSCGAVAVILSFVVALGVRSASGRSWTQLGTELPVQTAELRLGATTGTFYAWSTEIGVVATCLAAGGLAWALTQRRARPLALGLSAFIIADMLVLRGDDGSAGASSTFAARLLALAALGAFFALAVRTAAAALLEMRVYMAQPAATLLVVFTATLTLVEADRSVAGSGSADAPSAAEIWTDEALGDLPRGSLLLVRSPSIAWRLWAARTLRGERPDLVVVPVPWLARGALAAQLLELEPALAELIRDVSIVGRPSELSLSMLADERPLYLEIGPDWDRRLMDHLRPEPMWLGFAPHALGRSDRRQSLRTGHRSFRRVLEVARDPSGPDAATLSVLGNRCRQHAVALAALGDRDSLDGVMHDLRSIDSSDPFVLEMGERLTSKVRGRLDARDLLQ